MCEKAEEIKKYFKDIGEGDFCFHKGIDNQNKPYAFVGLYDGEYGCDEDDIWLPRQDQLQEMVSSGDFEKDFKTFWLEFRNGFDLFELPDWAVNQQNYLRFTSMEQLWLAFYMAEKFNKYWDGNQWIE